MQSGDIIHYSAFACFCGTIVLASYRGSIILARWESAGDVYVRLARISRQLGAETVSGRDSVMDNAIYQIEDYLNGKRRIFDIPILLHGKDFQNLVWRKACEIAYGSVISYAQLAAAVGRPSAVRAVANALAANPCALFVPCHRIVGSKGQLTGYAGGKNIKKQLLELESAAMQAAPPPYPTE